MKGVLNSVCSRPNGKFLTADIDNYYLNTPLDRPEYVRIKIDVIPQEFIDEYNLMAYVHNGWVYFEITKGIYGLKQAGKLANDLLTERLAAHGYYQCATTAGLWRHRWRQILFVLIVDDFGIEYVIQQMQNISSRHYAITTPLRPIGQAPSSQEWTSCGTTPHVLVEQQ